MRRVSLLVLVLICFASFNCSAWAQPTNKYLLGTLEVLADKALEGYNSQDAVQFYEYFAKSMEPVTTDQYFENFFIKGYMKDFGLMESKMLSLGQSSLRPDFPSLVYKAKFQNYDNVLITVNFQKEYDNYRITQIKFDKDYSFGAEWKGF